jgi:hypothetical protein
MTLTRQNMARVDIAHQDLLGLRELTEDEMPAGLSPRGYSPRAIQVWPWRCLKLHLQQPVRVGKQHLAGLVEVLERFGVAALVVQDFAEHGVRADGVDPSCGASAYAKACLTTQRFLGVEIVARVKRLDAYEIGRAGDLVAELRGGRRRCEH